MPISFSNKLIFVHVPKTGDSSIEKQLNLHPSQVSSTDERVVLSGGNNQFQHLTLSQILKIKGDELDGFNAFGMVREPFSRIVSEYKWRKISNHPIVEGLNLDEFINKIYTRWIKKEYLDSHFTRQTDFFTCEHQKLNDLTIFKFENGFKQVANYISHNTGLKIEDFPVVNHTRSFKEKLSISDSSKKMMYEIFKPDFDFYE
eukprot:TRINITY_DN1381_c0_g1_i1.p2 TRINITY_DN1381_c0_g1~~TRINITY_DN1381_c0_g1_i1.p2  ORF type:complete len:202 (+),score=26.28 TRINITY_DN1381_c0_g1_i1:132-737(+)